ncbi:MAG TPA: hypothetical protein DEV22_02735 [Collinsella sp.]|nr:hypothetical protein [Collinsella sp.]
MSRETAKGTWFEREVADFLAEELGSDFIERKAKSGSADEGDIAGVRLPDGGKVAVECKNRARLDIPGWLREAEVERRNYGAEVGIVVYKLRGVGAAHMGDQAVAMTLSTLAALLKSRKEQ